jgi:transcriptional regulator with XRE-family HTH domain
MTNYPGDNLRRLIARAGLTLEQVAAKCRLDPRTIKGILDGSNRPHARTLHRLAAGLGVSPDEFFLDPAQLVYRCLDRATNPLVAEVVESRPELFSGWTEADYEELHSRFGTGGPLTLEGALAAVDLMNRNRKTLERLAVLLESSQAELIRGIVEVMYDKLVTSDAAAPRATDSPGPTPGRATP